MTLESPLNLTTEDIGKEIWNKLNDAEHSNSIILDLQSSPLFDSSETKEKKKYSIYDFINQDNSNQTIRQLQVIYNVTAQTIYNLRQKAYEYLIFIQEQYIPNSTNQFKFTNREKLQNDFVWMRQRQELLRILELDENTDESQIKKRLLNSKLLPVIPTKKTVLPNNLFIHFIDIASGKMNELPEELSLYYILNRYYGLDGLENRNTIVGIGNSTEVNIGHIFPKRLIQFKSYLFDQQIIKMSREDRWPKILQKIESGEYNFIMDQENPSSLINPVTTAIKKLYLMGLADQQIAEILRNAFPKTCRDVSAESYIIRSTTEMLNGQAIPANHEYGRIDRAELSLRKLNQSDIQRDKSDDLLNKESHYYKMLKRAEQIEQSIGPVSQNDNRSYLVVFLLQKLSEGISYSEVIRLARQDQRLKTAITNESNFASCCQSIVRSILYPNRVWRVQEFGVIEAEMYYAYTGFVEHLDQKELLVLSLISKSKTFEEISQELGIDVSDFINKIRAKYAEFIIS